ncbi:hypothetical protein DFH09DRAFT_1144326 [Mycena vulgaris]|nr:hypothetical protein DFH09DRAFT_1144326 [Mycena vulgaris]
MPDPRTPTTIGSGLVDDPANIPPPKLDPPATGNLIADSLRSAAHIGEVPCARNSLLSGIASGVGIGFIRGISVSPIIAGNWAMGTFFLVASTSWYLCTKKIEEQQRLTRAAIQNLPKQLRLKEDENDPSLT